MDRIQHSTATPDHRYTEGDPETGTPATVVTATWLNGVQEELVHLLVVAGITPDAGNLTQVKAALDTLYAKVGDLSSLQSELAAETSEREAADAALAAVQASTNAAVAAETEAREAADTALQSSMEAADEALQTAIAGETEARMDAVEGEEAARIAADASLASALALQQNLVRTFSSLLDFLPAATPTDLANIIGQNRLVRTRRADGRTLFGTLEFQWSATFANSGSCGWALGASSGDLAAEIVSALRELWGIGPSDEWPHPYIFGDLYVGGARYTLAIYNQPAGPKFSITGGVNTATAYPFGRISLHVPGVSL